jgi:hypothetical protein
MDLDLAAIDPLWLAVAAGVLLLVIVAIVVAVVRSRRRHARNADRYGAEYQRTVEEAGSRRAADRELHEREERRKHFELRALGADERDRFRARWEDLQASFVDGPAAAVRSADALLDDVADARGYPKSDRERRLADLSVDHPSTVDEYRRSRPTSDDDERGPTTEQLRVSLVSSRSLFEALLGRDTEDVGIPPAPFRELEGAEDEDGPPRADRATPTGDQRSHTDGVAPVDGHDAADGAAGGATDTEPRGQAGHDDTSPVLGPDGRPLHHDRSHG